MLILGIETTCDETAVAIVEDGHAILSNVIASQSDVHKKFGGVFPEIAAREHMQALLPTFKKALDEAGVTAEDIDLIAVAQGPGLIGPLMIGLTLAKTLHLAWDIPYIGVDHVEAHLYSAMMGVESPPFPAIGLVVSGGHTFLTLIRDVGEYELIGKSVDDALGEAFDKVATLLDLPYPGGPQIERLASKGDSNRFPFKAGKVKGRPWDFSYSGLKTNVLYALKGQNGSRNSPAILDEEEKKDVAASFQEVALCDVVRRTCLAAKEFGAKGIYVGGGVSQSRRLRALFERMRGGCPIFWPDPVLCMDNGAMIAGLAFHKFEGVSAPLDLQPYTKSPIIQSALC